MLRPSGGWFHEKTALSKPVCGAVLRPRLLGPPSPRPKLKIVEALDEST